MNRRRKQESVYDEVIEKVRESLLNDDPDNPEYQKKIEYLAELHKMRTEELRRDRVKPDTIAIVAGNLLGILILVGYERAHVVTSKGLQFLKPNSV